MRNEIGTGMNTNKPDANAQAGRPFLVIGVTGGIGSGKSTVSEMMAKLGARVIDADALSRRATEPGMPAVAEIAGRFGPALVSPDGRLDRAELAAVVFADPNGRRDLEAIVHRRVVEAIDQQLVEWTEAGFHGWVVLDVPIPVKRGFLDVSDEIWVVDSPEAVRVERVMKRSGLSAEEVRRRMAAQIGPEADRSLATRILPNDGQPAHLERLVQEFLEDADSHRPCGTWDADDKLKPRTGTGSVRHRRIPMSQPMFERDLLYPTESQFEPGSVHIRVFSPDPDGRIPVHVEAKSVHDPLSHLDTILTIMQSDIFDRIRIDLKKSCTIFLYPNSGSPVVRVQYAENGIHHTEKIVHPDN